MPLIAFSWILLPLVVIAFDILPSLRAGRARVASVRDDTPIVKDFEVLVPIYGDVKYLENVDFLRTYGAKVTLCTTDAESDGFYDELEAIAQENGFRVFKTAVEASRGRAGRRSVAAPIRDVLIREALLTVVQPYVVCIDADTSTSQPLSKLVGALVADGYDLASVRLVPSNKESVLAKVQHHEYRMSMRMRRLYPWLISGACHVARTSVHRDLMQRHSLFFQGNDAELGILAAACGNFVGHIQFDVPTTVPAGFRPWLRQRYAWAGGEFRLFAVNILQGRRHPVFFLYGAVIVILASPFRWGTILSHPWMLWAVFGVYMAFLLALNWRWRDWTIILLPFYSLFSTLILVPLGAVSYAQMARTHRNAGIIRPKRTAVPELAGLPRGDPSEVDLPGADRLLVSSDEFSPSEEISIDLRGTLAQEPSGHLLSGSALSIRHTEMGEDLDIGVLAAALLDSHPIAPSVREQRVLAGHR